MTFSLSLSLYIYIYITNCLNTIFVYLSVPSLYIFLYIYRPIGIMVRVFANGSGDRGSIQGRVIPKTQKWYLSPPCLTLSIIRYGSRVSRAILGEGVVLSPTPRCSSYRKGSLRVTLDNSRLTYLLVYIHLCLSREH